MPQSVDTQIDLNELRDRVDRVERSVTDNTAAVCRVEDNTREIIDMFESLKGAFKTLEHLGKLAKPLTYVVMFFAAAAGLWTSLKGLWK